MIRSLKQNFKNFISNNKTYPILTIVAGSIYPLAYYYDKNYPLINSKSQFLFLVSLYILAPLLAFVVINFILKQIPSFRKQRGYLLSLINLVCFFVFIVITVYGFHKTKLVLAALVGGLLGILFAKHIKKIVILQFLLVFLVLPKLVPDLYREVFYSKEWMNQPDDIETAVFKERPNIYVIQPDGYASFSSFKNDLYNFDNSQFEAYLNDKGFKTYEDFRSNYFSTLSSNSSLLSMKHHYYGNKKLGISPQHESRNIIVEENPVLKTFKHNNYKTFLLLQVPYLLSNRPQTDFDYCNIPLDEVSYISRGFEKKKDLLEDTKLAIKENKPTSNFFFIESMKPSHIATYRVADSSVENERLKYLEKVKDANLWLMKLISFISQEDPTGIIIIAADHGGYVGLNSSSESSTKVSDSLIINSMFASALAIKWPNGEAPDFDDKLHTSVNLFRILFTYLSKDKAYLKHLQDDKSYIVIRKGAPTGVYEYINDEGETVFNKLE